MEYIMWLLKGVGYNFSGWRAAELLLHHDLNGQINNANKQPAASAPFLTSQLNNTTNNTSLPFLFLSKFDQ